MGRGCSRACRKPCFRKRTGQTRIRISSDVNRRPASQLFDEWIHFIRTERTVQSDYQWLRVPNRDEKRFRSLTAQRSAGFVRYRSGNDQWKFFARCFEDIGGGKKGRLCAPTFKECFDL